MSTKRDASRGLTEQRQVRGGQEWGLRHRNVGPGGEQVRKGEGLAVEGQRRCSEGLEGEQCWSNKLQYVLYVHCTKLTFVS